MKASSESGLWAIVISRVSTAALLITKASPIEISCLLLPGETPPTRHNPRGRSNFQDFSQNKPVESELGGASQRVSVNVEPAQSPGEQDDFSQIGSGQRAQKGLLPSLHHITCNPGDKRIRHQVSTGKPEDLSQPARSHQGIENWQPCGAFGQVQSKRSQAPLAAEQHAHEQDAEILQRERNRSWS